MKTFLAVYLGTPDGFAKWSELPESVRQAKEAEGIAAWHAWNARLKDRIAFEGGPLGRTKRIDPSGIVDVRNAMAGFVVLRAESQEAAARLFEGHPHFSIFPGESVEVMECLPIPGM